jgi:serine phosphatase RsbU (regulator of sigma subunit)/Tfp pilus assembly protein PilF
MPLIGTAQLSADQQSQVDSLQQVIKTAKHDTIIVNAWIAWDNIVWRADPDMDFVLNQKIDSLCSKNLKQNLNKQEKAMFLKSKAFALNSFGIIYEDQGDYAKAVEYYTQSLKIREEIGDKKGIATSLNNIGNIYQEQGDYAKAIEYYTQSLKIYEEIGNKHGIAGSLGNIGNIYDYQGESTKAIEYYTQSLKIQEEIEDKSGTATSLNNIGAIYYNQGDYAKSIDYYTQSLKIYEEIEDKSGIAISLNNIGGIYNKQGETAKAFEYSMRSLTIAQEIGAAFRIKEAASSLWEITKKLGRYKESLEMYELFIATRDSIDSEENQKAVIQQEYKYAYEKQAAADSITNAEADKVKDALLTAEKAENKQHQLEATAQKQQAYFLYGGLGLALLFSGFIFNRFRVTSKQKGVIEEQKGKVETTLQEVEHQKEIIEEAHKEITDSIDYAERIQRSFLATKEILDTNLKDYFVFFKPKDVVSGDFYWADLLSNGTFAVVNADSTGHGVPGAIMSILNISSIEGAVKEGSTTPHEIFNKTRQSIIKRLKKDGSPEGGKDGMDASIICFDFENKKLTYTAAQNPIWVIRDNEVIQIKAEKMPVGKHDLDHMPFVGGEFDLQKGDIVYTLTDGFQDQFGGSKGKKFMIKKMREYVLSISHLPMQEQHEKLDETFSNWKGDLEQVDDVCVIGVRI